MNACQGVGGLKVHLSIVCVHMPDSFLWRREYALGQILSAAGEGRVAAKWRGRSIVKTQPEP